MTSRNQQSGPFVLGRDATTYGRIARALAGAWLVLAGIAETARGDPDQWLGLGEVVQLLAATAAASLLYTAVTLAIGDRVLPRLNPWTATALLLIPVIALYGLSAAVDVPPPLLGGMFVYVGLSLLLIAATGYGGCEIIGLPAVVLRRRYTVYCAMNTIDAAERPFTRSRTTARLAAGVPAVVAGVYYFVGQPLLYDVLGLRPPFDPRVGAVLLLPAIAVLTRQAWSGLRADRRSPDARSHLVGAAALTANAAGILVFGSVFYLYATLTALIAVIGLVKGVQQATAAARSRALSRREAMSDL